MQYKYGKRAHKNLLVLGRFYFHFCLVFYILKVFLIKTIIALAFAGYEMILVNSALYVSTGLVGYLSSHIQERQQFYFRVVKYFQFQQEKIIFTFFSHRKIFLL